MLARTIKRSRSDLMSPSVKEPASCYNIARYSANCFGVLLYIIFKNMNLSPDAKREKS